MILKYVSLILSDTFKTHNCLVGSCRGKEKEINMHNIYYIHIGPTLLNEHNIYMYYIHSGPTHSM